MRAIIFSAIFSLFSFSAGATFPFAKLSNPTYPACPQPPSADTLNGDAAGRAAYFRLVAACLCDWARYSILANFSHHQNLNTASLILSPTVFKDMTDDISRYRTALDLCQ